MTIDEFETEPTLKDIAAATGLSMAAVSKVLNNREGVSQANRERVMRTMTALGYRKRKGRSSIEPLRQASVLTLGRYASNDSFYGEILNGIIEAGTSQGIAIDVKIASDGASSGSIEHLFPLGLPNALLLVGIDNPALIAQIADAGIRSVLVNGMDRSMRLSSVSPDYLFGGWLATRHLIELGHREILHVTHPYRESIRQRMDGFRNAIQEAGITFEPVRHVLDLGTPQLMTIDARDIISAYLANTDRRPTAIVCVNDIVALATMQAIQSHGLSVPDDISVIGFDDLPVGAHSSPSLTTIRVDREELGRSAVRLLLTANNVSPVQRMALGTTLVKRGSTSPPARMQS